MTKSSTNKKHDLPAMPFYFGDWRKAPEIRALDLDVRMIWFEMLGLMWESTERGYLTLNMRPVSNSVITRMLGTDIVTFDRALQQLNDFNVFSRREDGAIFSRKMVRDEELRLSKSKAGKTGMDMRYNRSVITDKITSDITSDITDVISKPEDENEIANANKSEKKFKTQFIIPTLEEVKQYFDENGYSSESAIKAHNHYSLANWHDVKNKPVLNWRQKMNTVWFKEENKKKVRMLA